MNVLIIEDDRDIAELVGYNLKQEKLTVHICSSGKAGLEYALCNSPDLIILDLMLPDMGGLDVCKTLRADSKTRIIPILMLTAKSEEIDRIIGLELGADDYLTKPFSTRELVLRVKAILRRISPMERDDEGEAFAFGGLQVNPEKFEVKVEGKVVQLTALEHKLLQFLYRMKGRVATRDVLLDRVWGYDAVLGTRTVDVHIKRLRKKLRKAGTYIETVRGVGYRFKESPE